MKRRRLPAGGEVVADYRATGLTLRTHPAAFLRAELARLGAVPCGALADQKPGRVLTVAGLVLVRQRPGSARGVMFATIEDETGHANIIVWPSVFERQRRIVLSASMIACRGRLQREAEVIHVVADELTDLSALLASVGGREAFALARGRGDEPTHGSAPDPRDPAHALGRKPRDLFCPDMRVDAIKVKTRDFR